MEKLGADKRRDGRRHKPGRALPQRYALIAHHGSHGKRDRDAAGDHRNLDKVKLTGSGRTSFDDTSEASLLKRWRIGQTDGHARQKNESFCGVGEAKVLWSQRVEAVPGNVIHQDDDQRKTAPKVDLRNALSLYLTLNLRHRPVPDSASRRTGQALGSKLNQTLEITRRGWSSLGTWLSGLGGRPTGESERTGRVVQNWPKCDRR